MHKSNKYQTFWSKMYKYKISVTSGNILRKSRDHMSMGSYLVVMVLIFRTYHLRSSTIIFMSFTNTCLHTLNSLGSLVCG